MNNMAEITSFAIEFHVALQKWMYPNRDGLDKFFGLGTV